MILVFKQKKKRKLIILMIPKEKMLKNLSERINLLL